MSRDRAISLALWALFLPFTAAVYIGAWVVIRKFA